MQKFGYLKCLDSSPSCKDLKKASDHLKFMLQLKLKAQTSSQMHQAKRTRSPATDGPYRAPISTSLILRLHLQNQHHQVK